MTPAQFAKVRARLGMTQLELGRAMGRTRTFIWRLEHGKCPIDRLTQLGLGFLLAHHEKRVTPQKLSTEKTLDNENKAC